MKRPTDFTHPNPPNDIPQRKSMMLPSLGLMSMATNALFKRQSKAVKAKIRKKA